MEIQGGGRGRAFARLKIMQTKVVAFSPNGKMLALAQGTRLRIWGTDSWSELLPASAHDDKINAVEFSPDGKRILTGGNDRKLIEWSWPEATELRRVEPVGSSWGISKCIVFKQ